MSKYSAIPGRIAVSPAELQAYEVADDSAEALIRLRVFTSKSDNYDAQPTDDCVLFSGGGNTHVNLPVTGLTVGQVMTIKNVGSGAPINIFTSGSEYAGNPQLWSVAGGAALGGCITLVWSGTAWWILSYDQ